jgi:hypothetical protein
MTIRRVMTMAVTMVVLSGGVQGCAWFHSKSDADAARAAGARAMISEEQAIRAAAEVATTNGYDVSTITPTAFLLPKAKLWVVTFTPSRDPTPPGKIVTDGGYLAQVYVNAKTGKTLDFMVGP